MHVEVHDAGFDVIENFQSPVPTGAHTEATAFLARRFVPVFAGCLARSQRCCDGMLLMLLRGLISLMLIVVSRPNALCETL